MALMVGDMVKGLASNRSSPAWRYQRGDPDERLGGWQDATGEMGVGAGIQGMWWGSDITKLKHAGKDLRATAMQWVPQLLESTPEAQTLFDEEEYLEMIRPQVEQALGRMMGGYRTSMDNIRRGLAARGLSASGLSQRMAGAQEGEMQARAAGMESQAISGARMNRLMQALNFRRGALALGLGVPQPMHQQPKAPESSGWGQVAGTVVGAAAGHLFGPAGPIFGAKVGEAAGSAAGG